MRTTSKIEKSSEKRFHFTERTVAGIKPPAEKRASYRDTEVKELGLLVQPSGFKSTSWQPTGALRCKTSSLRCDKRACRHEGIVSWWFNRAARMPNEPDGPR